MYKNASINLIKSTSEMPESMAKIENQVVLTSYVIMGVVVIFLASVLGLNFFISNRLSVLKSDNNKLVKIIESMREKESRYLVVKSRLDSIKVIRSKSKPVDRILDLAISIIPPPVLTKLLYDEEGNVSLTYTIGTIEEARSILDSFLKNSDTGKIVKPSVKNINIKDNILTMTVAFVPVTEEGL